MHTDTVPRQFPLPCSSPAHMACNRHQRQDMRREKGLERKNDRSLPKQSAEWKFPFYQGRVLKWMSSKNYLLPQGLCPHFEMCVVPMPANSCPFAWLHLRTLWSLLLRSSSSSLSSKAVPCPTYSQVSPNHSCATPSPLTAGAYSPPAAIPGSQSTTKGTFWRPTNVRIALPANACKSMLNQDLFL